MRKRHQVLSALIIPAMLLTACGEASLDTTTTTSEPAATTTEAPSTTTTSMLATTTTKAVTGEIVPGEDPDVDEIVEVYRIAFDSTTTFEEKAAVIEDTTGLEDTVDTYASTGDSVGGVTAEPTAVTVEGDDAVVVYTLYFSGNPTYAGLNGTAVKIDGGWKITRDMFCSVMASARSACPAS